MKITFLLFLALTTGEAFARFTDADLQKLIAQSVLRDSDALMVWQNGEITHNSNKHPDALYSIQSVTKSITSLTVQCLAKNKPDFLEQKNLFPEWTDTPKAEITLRQLLQMSSGIQDPADFWTHNEFYDYSLSLPLVTQPGWSFSYANASTMLVARWILDTTKETLSVNMQKCYFDPMGIKEWKMSKDKSGNEVASGGLYLKAQDLMKFGIMLIQNGMFEGKRYLSQNQVFDLRSDYLKDGNGYGLGFWTWGTQIYYMEGFLGQFVMIVPRENLVVLRIRNNPDMQWSEEADLDWFHEMPWFLQGLI
jgi:CubicO group peptidase (beta-lactamase class C family)